MKKTLVALAALATVGAAFAQSSVTLYGRIDASIASQRTSVGGVTTVDVGTQIASGAHTGSRWGMKGTEDLGGGLKANFQIENGFAVDTGAGLQGGLMFGRQAWVGLSGGFGAVTVGRQYDVIDNMYANYDPMGYSGYSSMGYAFNVGCGTGGSGDCVGRQNNAVIYTTPAMSGFSGSVMWAPGENRTPVFSSGSMYGLMASYGNGPFSVGGAWQSNKAGGGAPATTNWLLGGSYDLTAVKLFAQFEGSNNKTANGKDNGYQLGLTAPVGAATLIASYAHENEKIAGARVSTAKAWSLMGQYPLSKRTYVYAAYLRGTTVPTAALAPSVKQTNYGLGLVHNF